MHAVCILQPCVTRQRTVWRLLCLPAEAEGYYYLVSRPYTTAVLKILPSRWPRSVDLTSAALYVLDVLSLVASSCARVSHCTLLSTLAFLLSVLDLMSTSQWIANIYR